jgi:hypothetical protein
MNYEQLEELGRVRLSPSFFMRDFLYSEIAAWHQLRNVPDHPDMAIQVGRQLCAQLLEPLQSTFGRLEIRSAYRSPSVNEFGNKNKLNCASNESNFAGHIWDYPDANGKRGATACIVIPWLVDHIARGGHWTDMAWWIHDHLPYSSLYFFTKLAAFNISWHEAPIRRIDSYTSPKGCLTRPGMANHAGPHPDQYVGFPACSVTGAAAPTVSLPKASTTRTAVPLPAAPAGHTSELAPAVQRASASTTAPAPISRTPTSSSIAYRAIHTKNAWRKVDSHRTLDAAINGMDGAAGLFAGKVRISYQTHGDPLYVLVWERGAPEGYVIKPDPALPKGIRYITVPTETLLAFERREQVSQRELEALF